MLIDLIRQNKSHESDFNYKVTLGIKAYYLNITDTTEFIQAIYDALAEDEVFTVEEHYSKGKVQPVLCISLGDDDDPKSVLEAVHSCQKAIRHTIKVPESNHVLTCAMYYIHDKVWIRFSELSVKYSTLIGKILPAAESLCSSVSSPSLVPLPLSLSKFEVVLYADDGPIADTSNLLKWLDNTDKDIREDEAVALILSKFTLAPQSYPASNKALSTLIPKDKKETKADFNKRLKTNVSIRSIVDKVDRPIEKPLKMLPIIFDIFDYNRIRLRSTWKEIGEALYATFTDEDLSKEAAIIYLAEGYKLWQTCTSRLNKGADVALYNRRLSTMKDIWDNFSVKDEYDDMVDHPSNQLNFDTLKFWAYTDNPSEYDRFRSKKLRKWLCRSLNINAADTEIADVIYYKYGMRYKVTSLEPKVIWYEFKRHRWVMIQKSRSLRRYLSEDVTKMYEDLQVHINNKLTKEMARLKDNSSDEEVNILAERCKQMLLRCGSIIKSLKTQSAKNTILNELSEILYDDEFQQVRDENPYLICHKNGVYDLKRYHLREGRPNDCITLSTNINLKEPSDTYILMVNQYMAQVFVDKSLREYVWLITSTYLEGYNFMKALYVLIGSGNNSKSAFINLLERVLGEYIFKLPIGILTNDSGNSEGPSPSLARGKGRRLGVFDELNKDGHIKDGPMKRITGNTDKQLCRNLYEAPFEYRPQFKSLLVTNNRIHATPDQPAVLERINEIVFESKFSKACPVSIEDQVNQKHFPIDISFDKKFPQMAEAFLYILTDHYYKKFKAEGINEPECIKEHRKRMLRSCDVFEQFKEEVLEEDKDATVNCREAYAYFKEWFREEHGKGEPPIKQDFIDMISKRIKLEPNRNSRSWIGISIKGKSVGNRIKVEDD